MKMIMYTCHWCNREFQSDLKWVKDMEKRSGRVYCCKECGSAYKASVSSKTMAKTNRKYASERMKRKNPMHNPQTREKVKTALRAMGWKPPVRGGNGHPLPVAQQLLACALGWETEYAVTLHGRVQDIEHLPTCYKIDIANSELLIGIEVDGKSHHLQSRQHQDRKKEAALSQLGWTILRFSNKDVTEDLQKCVQMVMSTISKLKNTTPTLLKDA